MRFCNFYFDRNIKCLIIKKFSYCIECKRFNQKCNLTSSNKEINKTINIIKKLNNKILEFRIRVWRLKKQRKHWLQKSKAINNVKAQTILKLKTNKRKKKQVNLYVTFASNDEFSNFNFVLFEIFSQTIKEFLQNFFLS